MTIHVEASFTHDASQRILLVNEPWLNDAERAPAPRFFLGRTTEGHVWRFRSDLPSQLVDRLEALCSREPVMTNLGEKPAHLEAYLRLLEEHEPVERVGAGPAYRVPLRAAPPAQPVPITDSNAGVLRDGFEEMAAELATAQPFFGILQGGCAVSICRSVRITPRGHEAGVETLDDFRGRGYAGDVVARWAVAVDAMGCVPLYSTSWENTASQNVAKKLGTICYGVAFGVA